MSGDNGTSGLEARIGGKSLARHVVEAAGLTAAVVGLHSLPAQVIETYYTNGFYRKLAEVVEPISNTDVHVSEWAIAGLGVYAACRLGLLAYRTARQAYQSVKCEGLPKAEWYGEKAVRGVVRTAKFAAGVALVASLGFYLNDRRPDVVADPVRHVSEDDLVRLEGELRGYVGPLQRTRDQSAQDLFRAMDSLYQKTYGVSFQASRRIKQTTWLLRALDRFGVSAPPLQEMTVDERLDAVAYQETAGHERAHLMGFSRESEASAFAFDAALQSGNRELRRLAVEWLWQETLGAHPGLAAYSERCVGEWRKNLWMQREPARTTADDLEDACFAIRGEGNHNQAYRDDTVAKCWAIYQKHPQSSLTVSRCGRR